MDDSLFLFIALAFLGAMLYYSSRKRKKAAEELRASVVKGAYVMLTSGIFGKVTAVLDNRIEFETAPGNKMLVAMGAVRSIEEEPKSEKSPAKKTASTAKSTSDSSKSATKPKAKSATKSK
jgi:preprotein translocase subunit YajC